MTKARKFQFKEDIKTEILRVHDHFWQALGDRDIEARFSFCDDQVTFIGTGLHEKATNKEEYIAINKKGIEQYPKKFKMLFLWKQVSFIDDLAWVESEVEWEINLDEMVDKETIRSTVVLKKRGGIWKIVHVHGSVPDYRFTGQNYMSTNETQRKNRELEMEVYKRTIELEKKSRELEIEGSLERVRAVAMGMKEPGDMLGVCKVISSQLQSLGVIEIRNVQTAIFYDQRGTYMNYEYYAKHDKTIITETTYTNNGIHNEFAIKMLRGKGENFITHIRGDEVKDWIAYQKTTNVFIDKYLETASSLSYYWFSLGPVALGISTYFPLTEDEINLFKRFLKVFELAYQRYLDIEKAEAQARAAQIEAALERVRSRSLAMHASADLSAVVYEMFTELVRLDAQLDRCLILIVNPQTLGIAWYLTGKEGLLSNNGFLIPDNPHPSHQAYLEGWRTKRKKWHYLLAGEEKRGWDEFGFTQTGLAQLPDFIKADMAAVEAIHLTISSDDFGCLIASSLSPLSEAHADIVDRFTTVFNLTYTRFNDLKVAEAHAEQAELDLKKLKEEKRRTEEALTELKATQAQLIHAEKMASLGELTAGIAHEIQNPLNFVNNFSEVSIELIDELKQESAVGGQRSAVSSQQSSIEILDDIRENLQKINHHGKRADAIVKGMLQHSRTSTGQKELTDINALADEYLRLAYHGLRAKDKSFNADFKSELDPDLPNIMIIPQDFGRVLLNLINNAFYAVDEKKKQQTEGYEPTVFLMTRKVSDKVEVKVKDNGNGIPQKILDKIFQPFFTTKPTGQGTGLGLSLSYDIVKAHGGELKVETMESTGTTFIIQIPITA